MLSSYRTTLDQTFLEDLLLSDCSTSAWPDSGSVNRGMRNASKKNKTQRYPLNVPGTTNHQVPFPSGSGSYPSQIMPMQQKVERSELYHKSAKIVPRSGDGEQNPQHTALKRREMGWNTSFPAEYKHSQLGNDYQLTLAYQEHADQRQTEYLNPSCSASISAQYHDSRIHNRCMQAGYFAHSVSNNLSSIELELLKNVMMREGVLTKMNELVKATMTTQKFDVAKGNELLQLLLQLRDASVLVMAGIATWHESFENAQLFAFWFENENYCAKMMSDLNFLAKIASLGEILGVDPSKMKQNPFMMPSPIPERNFTAVQALPWSKLTRVSSADPVERVAEAEKYLVWCLMNLSYPPSYPLSTQSFPLQYNQKNGMTWQQRAEKQLKLLSMPLEAPTGNTHLMDSSRMMKRKGCLPSLPLSPPKTLTELMENVSHVQAPIEKKTRCLRALWNGVEYQTIASDLKALGAMETPPHHMVTLVAACVLILLSPSDRLPKDLSWVSCKKMLQSGPKLIDRMNTLVVASVPDFKWKALQPFFKNEHFQPEFLSTFGAGGLCAWIFAAFTAARNQELLHGKNEQDQLDLLAELEIDDDGNSSQHFQPLAPLDDSRPKSKNSKRVSIGNAEVLFINENQPVTSSSPRPGTSGSPRPSSGTRTTSIKKPQNMLLRTSPWTFHGVTYFVSFFLEQDGTVISIKLYEPMSSVESQIYVNEEDLLEDFGAAALEQFRGREFRSLCDVILGQLDNMMSENSQRKNSDIKMQSQQDHLSTRSSIEAQARGNLRVDEGKAMEVGFYSANQQQILMNEPPSSQQQHASAIAIQCAARQQQARKKVKRVRFQKQEELNRYESISATKIQSVARQKLAKNEVSRRKLLQRTPTGLPPKKQQWEEESIQSKLYQNDVKGQIDCVASCEPSNEDCQGLCDPIQVTREPLEGYNGGLESEDTIIMPPADHYGTVEGASRPETVMSYASDQFEDE